MNRHLLRVGACFLMLHMSWLGTAWAQAPAPSDAAQAGAAQTFNIEQLDALLAPIALYPDPLLTQILMASTFPLQVVQAARWAEQPAHKGLSGDALMQALEPEPWDPSVKSLLPFPQVLAMMNADLDWTQQVGYAFADQQAEVLNSVQRLRRQAQSNGKLQSSPQQVVRTENQSILIESAQPDVVYVPSYQPAEVYGSWPYPSYPPVYLPPPPGYAFGTALATGLAFGAGIAVTAGLWNWAQPSWGGGYANVNVNRYNNINANRGTISSNRWQANRPGGRPAGLARPPGGPVGRPARSAGLPANAIGRSQVSVPGSAVRPSGRAGTPAAGAAGRQPGGRQPGGGAGVRQPAPGARPAARPAPSQARPASRPASTRANAFSGMGDGRQAGQYGQRGAQSRSFSQSRQPSGGGARGGGARGGGGRGGGGRGGGRR